MAASTSPPLLFCGSSHEALGAEIGKLLKSPCGKMELAVFPDRESSVKILEDVRGRDVFVLQSTGLHPNHYLMELLIIIDALKRSSAKSITAIIPYFGYCRQDRKDRQGVPITAKLVANMLTAAGISRLITCDLHAGQLEGFFEIPVDHLHCQKLLVHAALEKDFLVVAPDIGSIKIAEKMAKQLGTDFVTIEKRRISPSEVNMTLIGHLSSKKVLIIDDICSTGNTLVAAAKLCRNLGAEIVLAVVTHAICAGDAVQKIQESAFDAFITTNTLPELHRFSEAKKIQVISIAPLIAEVIKTLSKENAD